MQLMSDDDMPSSRGTGLSRRALLTTTAGAVTLSAGHAAATTPAEQAADDLPANDRPAAVARAYVEALNAGDREAVNELIAANGPVSAWSSQEFEWVRAFEITYVNFETVTQRDGDLTADITLTIAGNTGTVRYRFRDTADGWLIWEAVDGLRSVQAQGTETATETNASAAAKAYVTALNADNRGAVNELIADDGALSAWSSREFEWVGAFEFEFVGFQAVSTDGNEIVGDIELAIAGNEQTLRYRFQEVAAGRVELSAPVAGLRTTGEPSAAAAADAYLTALETADRVRANELIADAGQLDPWSEREFEWVGAFSLELVGFEPTQQRTDSVVADLTVRIAGTTASVRCEFRRIDAVGWKLWDAPDSITAG